MKSNPKEYKIPSRSEPGVYRHIYVWDDGRIECDCPAIGECFHIRAYKRWKGEMQGDPEKCFYTHDIRQLEEHHLLRGAERQRSLSVYLTHWIHERATWDPEFAEHLVNIYFNKEKMENFSVPAKIKTVSVKNLASGDKGVRIELLSDDLEALKLGRLSAEQMVKVRAEDNEQEWKFYALVITTRKQNYKNKPPEVEISLEVAPAEHVNAYSFGMMEPKKEVEIVYKKVNKSS